MLHGGVVCWMLCWIDVQRVSTSPGILKDLVGNWSADCCTRWMKWWLHQRQTLGCKGHQSTCKHSSFIYAPRMNSYYRVWWGCGDCKKYRATNPSGGCSSWVMVTAVALWIWGRRVRIRTRRRWVSLRSRTRRQRVNGWRGHEWWLRGKFFDNNKKWLIG